MDRELARPSVPEHIGGRYEVLLPIASGGMATVFLARARGYGGFEQDVALKLTHAHLRESKEFADSLVEEGKLAARVRHRNVVSVIDVGDDPRGVFLVMEYVEGTTLSVLRGAPVALPLPVALRILLDAMAGLHAAHETEDEQGRPLGIVHRDFSPHNILVGIDGVGRLADFGIAKAANALGQTVTGVIKGKVSYMSPEQARAERVDRRADVWAAGVIAWELLAGRRLYDSNETGLLFRIATEVPPRLRSVDPKIPVRVEEAVARALMLAPDRRWPTVSEYGRALADACRDAYGIADQDEVGRHVRVSVGTILAARRAAAAEVLRRRGSPTDSGVRATSPDGPPARGSTVSSPVLSAETRSMWKPASIEVPPTDTTAVSASGVQLSRVWSRPRRYAAAAVGTVVLVTAIGVVRFVTGSIAPSVDGTPPQAASSAVNMASAPPASSESEVPPAPRLAAPTPPASARPSAPPRRAPRPKTTGTAFPPPLASAPPLAPDPYAR